MGDLISNNSGVTSTQSANQELRIRIQEVSNGYTITHESGNYKTLVARDPAEVIDILTGLFRA